MPSSMLFAVNNEGKIFGLSTNGTKWREFQYLGLEFKQVSAVLNFLWAVGSDRQIYVHVHGLDIPIRIKEEAYENQVGRLRLHLYLYICIIYCYLIYNLFAYLKCNKYRYT